MRLQTHCGCVIWLFSLTMSSIDVLFDNDTTNDDEHLRATIIMMMIMTKVCSSFILLSFWENLIITTINQTQTTWILYTLLNKKIGSNTLYIVVDFGGRMDEIRIILTNECHFLFRRTVMIKKIVFIDQLIIRLMLEKERNTSTFLIKKRYK